ncbi:leucine Rich repeat-containing domain protein [Porphyromonas gingivalis W4087]|uniref:leucine-rich repeat domain-containing protein n=1 Tax=Porphyromonas gingivalis TaxID=837 RepID=UPI0003AD1218|nr:leucine-rich repeat domain-containing protein [Porphyromonas gingivalis]ERJ87008.1 leucine Rich repeat-containing domain protein [Porphyromonas gingivalis W4087]PDP62204.1 miro-like protein [Porphyromonas gingivalis]PDP74834.1 miro-like protein [Porphyromonas gingivalis]
MKAKKPQAILDLEKAYNIEIPDLSLQEEIDWWVDRYFKQDSSGAVVELRLRECQIDSMAWLVDFPALKKLDLSYNQIRKFEGLDHLASLTELDLSGNQIAKLEGLNALTSLTELYLSGNQIAKLEGLNALTSLTRLDLSGNQISKLESLASLTSLTRLDLSDNQIAKLEGLDSLSSSTWLDLSYNQIRKLEGLDHLTSLRGLDLSGNQLIKLEGLDSLTSLTGLYLSDNQIATLEGLDHLTSLRRLNLSGNQLIKLEGLEHLTSLTELDLSGNQISNLEELKDLTQLQELDVSGNDIQSVDDIKPLSLILGQRLKDLKIHNNPFVELSGLILSPYENHLPEIKALLEKEKQKKTSVEYHPFCKVMLLGNHDSGKTTFLSQYDTNYTYQENTHVLSIHRSNNPNAIFYDFGGQDYYHGIYQAFFTTQSLYLLFWDAKKDRNFVSVDDKEYQTLNFNRPYWLGQIAYACNRCMSVGGNPDGKDTPQTTDDTIIIQTHADETGAKQQTLGCAAENGVLEEIYVSLEPKANSAVHALNYLNERVREVVASRSKSIQITEKDRGLYEALPSIAGDNKHSPVSLEALAAELNMGRDENDLYTIEYLQTELNQLSLRGEVLYYRENEKLNSYVWLDPAAFVQMIHGEILQKDDINRGTVPKEVFERKLHRLSSGSTSVEHVQNGNMTLQLLLEELIVYEDKDCYVIPGYLPLHSDDEAYKWLTLGFERPNFVLKFERFIPFGLINQIIAYYGREEGALKRYWRDQVIFTAGREMDRRQIEQEEKKEGLPKANAEDYLIWIKLDFTDLAISVFIKEQRKTSAKDMQRKEVAILSDILDMYWNNIPPREQIGDKGAEQTRSTIRETNRKKRPIQDLYLSCAQADKDLTESHYIHLGTLDDESKTTARIAAYPLKDGAIDKERVREVSTRPYKHLSVNKNLSGVKRVFISYSKHDREELEQCLLFFKPLVKSGHIELYYDELTKFETPIHSEIRRRITGADCIIALVSQNYLGTDYILDHELPVIEDYEKTLIPIQIKPCTFYEVETLSKHYFALKAKVVNLDSRIFTVPDGVTASALREQNWCDVVREFKEKILRITKQEVNTDE